MAKEKIGDELREKAGTLLSKKQAIPIYCCFRFFFGLPKEEDINKACKKLNRLSFDCCHGRFMKNMTDIEREGFIEEVEAMKRKGSQLSMDIRKNLEEIELDLNLKLFYMKKL
jgi:hypothetical protein